eukprot:1186870-Prorocentrum_minimum.AAC.1
MYSKQLFTLWPRPQCDTVATVDASNGGAEQHVVALPAEFGALLLKSPKPRVRCQHPLRTS